MRAEVSGFLPARASVRTSSAKWIVRAMAANSTIPALPFRVCRARSTSSSAPVCQATAR